MQTKLAADASPYGLVLEKFSHHLKLGQRVEVKHWQSGATHRGEISNISDGGGRVHVLVDGTGSEDDRRIQCFASEVTPENFPAAEVNLKGLNADNLKAQAELARERIAKGVGAGFCSPFGGPTDDELLVAKLESWTGDDTMQKSEAADALAKAADLPEEQRELLQGMIKMIRAGRTVTLPPNFRNAFSKVPNLAALVSSGQIQFSVFAR